MWRTVTGVEFCNVTLTMNHDNLNDTVSGIELEAHRDVTALMEVDLAQLLAPRSE
jgi:hypothetical protein